MNDPGLEVGTQSEAVSCLQDTLRQAGYRIPPGEAARRFFGPGTRDAVRRYQQDHGLPINGAAGPATLASLTASSPDDPVGSAITQAVAADPPDGPPNQDQTAAPGVHANLAKPVIAPIGPELVYVVTGTVSSPANAAVGVLELRLVDKNVGGDVALACEQTDVQGRFTLQAVISAGILRERHKPSPDLQVQVLQGGAVIASSIVRYNAAAAEELDVVLPATAALPSEHETLTAALGSLFPGSLADLEESADRQDITYLANKSGWDGRAVAMASLAAQFSQAAHATAMTPGSSATALAPVPAASSATAMTQGSVDPAYYYALFRAGLPTDPARLYRTSPDMVEAIWKQAASHGIIPAALGNQTAAAREAFLGAAAAVALTAPPPAGPSPLGELLQAGLGNKDSRQQQFVGLLVRCSGDPATLWAQTEQAFGAAVTAQFKLAGQLADLTVNNAPLITALHQAARQRPLTAPVDLVTAGYYQASAWEPLLAKVNPPAEIAGSTPTEQKANYAEFLAAQLRLSFPTATIAQLAASGAFGAAVQSSGAGSLLMAHQATFDIGDEPIGRYLCRTNTTVPPDVVGQISRLQRVYQITPDAASMGALLTAGLDSAYAVTRIAQATFVRTHAEALGGPRTAEMVYARAQSIYASTLHVALSYLSAKKAPSLGSGAFSSIINPFPIATRPSPCQDGAAAQATLESLFGDLDYCQCDDCQSITSPAAYLVDLLDWINKPSPTAPGANPQDVLLARRPDIGTLPLTCDNTNTALPYIDLVNETLEYYVGNAQPPSLTGFAGYDNDGTVSSAELIASPQNDDNQVAQNAYEILKTQCYPPPLPFYRDLELLRQHIARFQITLYQVMEALRTTDNLESPVPSDPSSYGWRDILAERLGLSSSRATPQSGSGPPAGPCTGLEYQLLTDSTLTLAQLYGYPQETADPTIIADVSALQEYSRRTGVAYTDLVSILKTRFINPASDLIPLLEPLHVPFPTLEALNNGTLTPAAFTAQLPAGLTTASYGQSGVTGWVTANYAALAGLIVIDVAGQPCDTSMMQLQYLNGSPLQDIDLVRLLRFIRLWRKLGLSIQQTDDLICALYPASANPSATALQQLDSGFLLLLPRAGLAYTAIDLLGLDPASDLESLLACWASISTGGSDSLYARMFLNPTVLRLDSAFRPDANGNLFAGPSTPLLTHQTAICAALNLTSGEFGLITGAAPGLGYDATTPLSLESISAIYRRAWLARTLQLSVLELLSLIAFTALDPFAPPVLDATHPVSAPLLDFVRRAQALGTANLAPVQALYLLWNMDLSSVSAPSDSVVTALAAALRAAFAAIDSQFSITGTATAATAQSLMSLVLGATAAGLFFGLLNNTFVTSTPLGYSQPTLPAAVINAAGGRLSYDDLGKTLSFGGYLDPATYTVMQAHAAGDTVLSGTLTALQAVNTQAVDAFFATYDDPHTPYLRPLFNAYVATADPAAALATLLNGLLPILGNLRKQEQALACATTAAGCDPSFAPALLAAAAVMSAANPADPSAAAVTDLTAIGQGGLSARFFLTNDPTAAPGQTVPVAVSLAYGPGNPMPAPAGTGTAIAAQWSGYLSATQDGDCNLRFTADTGATITSLTVNGQPVAMNQTATGSATVWANQSPIALRAGALTPIQITATGLTSTFSASWQTLGTGWQPIPAASLYSDILLGYLRTTLLRFLKATALASDLALTAAEISYLASAAGLTVGGQNWLAALPVDAPAPAASFPDVTKVLDGLLTFATLKAAYSPLSTKTPQLLTTVKDMSDPAQAATATAELLALTRWDGPSLQALLPRLFNVTTLAALPDPLPNLARLKAAFAIVAACRLSAATLIEAATNDPTPKPTSTVLSDFQSAVRSRYSESDWLTVVQPINDSLREIQRDALVAYILAQSGTAILTALGIAAGPGRVPTPDDLFNYFLLDTEMESCMQTSRIRLALSSIQLFIERCLHSLEPAVNPADICRAQWDWRKRYRVWQANREVFLWPENWQDASLRDDQSPFFKTAMSQLLQSDITDDTAAAAYLGYLSNLEGVAKLDPCGLYYDQANDLAHVIARTGGANRKYYYRRLEVGAWTPWEEVKLSIEDNPVIPYVWNGRLLLLWLQLQHQSNASPANLCSMLPQTPPTAAGAPAGQTSAGTAPASAGAAAGAIAGAASSAADLPNPANNGQTSPGTAPAAQTLATSTLSDVSGAVATSAVNMTCEQVCAVLWFSEYYNGTWQPAKSSDITNPLSLGTWQPGTFDRSQLYLSAWTAVDTTDKSLYVQIQQPNGSPDFVPGVSEFLFGDLTADSVFGAGLGFVLHNTHSAPVTWADVPPTELASPTNAAYLQRWCGPPQTLTVTYGSPTDIFNSMTSGSGGTTQTILAGKLPQAITIAQSDIDDQWYMPFFFGDARNVFYVTPSFSSFSWGDFEPGSSGFKWWQTASTTTPAVSAIPSLVVHQGPAQPGAPVQITGGKVSGSIAQRAVTAGGLRAVIGGGAAVTFHGRGIGVTGGVAAIPSAATKTNPGGS
jgi:hypothetical protein